MASLDDIFPSKWLGAADLKGREISVIIASAEVEDISKSERKLVIRFQGKEKGLVCNKTNSERIAHYYGRDTDDWIGCEIILYPDLVDFQGKPTEAIRVKGPAPKAAQPKKQQAVKPQQRSAPTSDPRDDIPTRELDDDIPF